MGRPPREGLSPAAASRNPRRPTEAGVELWGVHTPPSVHRVLGLCKQKVKSLLPRSYRVRRSGSSQGKQ